jgi:hypothetical protein
LLNNGCFVITEDAPHNPYADCLVAVPYEDLVDRCLFYLHNSEERERIAREGLERFSRRPMTEYLRPVVELALQKLSS